MPDASSLMTMQQIRHLYNLQKANVTANYDSTATYEIGDYCLYLGVLYRCISTISTAEDFDSSHWVSTNVDAELDRIETVLSDVYRKSQTYSRSEAVAKVDIVNDLTSSATDKPGSANMLKTLNDKHEFASVRYTLANNASVAITATTIFIVSVKNASADQIMGGCVFASLLSDALRIHTISGNNMIGLSYSNGVITITNTGGMYQTFMIMYK